MGGVGVRAIWIVLGIVMVIIGAYLLNLLSTMHNGLWHVLNNAGVEQPPVANEDDYRTRIFLPALGGLIAVLIFSVITYLITTLREQGYL